MFGLGTPELIVIGVIVLLLFGAKRIPDIGKGLGGAIREFKGARKEVSGDHEDRKKQRNRSQQTSLESQFVEKVVHQVPASNRRWM